jgi:UDP-N-acetylmuramyl pentapeptide phosphotransferase/UDP-N-acetylglucosamine-1-phosphate transferase
MNALIGLSVTAICIATGSYLGVSLFWHYFTEKQILDIPNERSSHSVPTPRGGGIVIVVSVLIGCVVGWWLLEPPPPFLPTLIFVLSAGLVALVSWRDDVRSVSNRVRLGVHSLGAIMSVIAFGYWQVINLPFIGILSLGWIGFIITFLWTVGLTNAYNFMDGIDGIAGTQAVVAGIGWIVIGWISEQPFLVLMGTTIAASSAGFLGHNWPPARIFMGDVGSAFLGFTLAVLAVAGSVVGPRLPLAGALVVWPFVFDTSFTLLRRLRYGENIFVAHRSHLYQRLVIAGWSHRAVTLLYLSLTVLGAVLAVLWTFATPGSSLAVAVLPLLCAFALWRGVKMVESRARAGDERVARKANTKTERHEGSQ